MESVFLNLSIVNMNPFRDLTLETDQYRKQSLKLTKVQSLFFPLIMGLIGLSTILTVYAGSAEVIRGKPDLWTYCGVYHLRQLTYMARGFVGLDHQPGSTRRSFTKKDQ